MLRDEIDQVQLVPVNGYQKTSLDAPNLAGECNPKVKSHPAGRRFHPAKTTTNSRTCDLQMPLDDHNNTGETTWHFLRHPSELGWKEFVDRYGPRIMQWCQKQGLEKHTAEDIAQEVLIRLHRSMHSLDPQQSFQAWLFTVTRNATRSYYRDARNRVCQPATALDWIECREQQLADFLVQQDLLAIAIERTRLAVPAKQWEAFRMRSLENMDYTDLESRLKLSRSVLMNYVSMVRKALKAELAALENG